MTKILKYLKPVEWISALICGAFVAFQVWLDLKLPDYMSEITMLIQTSGEINQILSVGGKMLLCAFGSLIAAFITGFIAAKIAAGFSKRLRSKIYNKVEAFSMEEINKFSTSSLITRSTNDITQVQMVIAMGLQVMIKAPIMAVWAILKISNKNWQWSLATGICVALVILLFGIIVVFAMPKFKVIQKLTDNLNRVTRENLQGVRVVRAYNAEEYQENKFKSANNELTDVHLFTTRLMAIMMPCMTLLMNGLSLSIYWIGAYLINSADMLQKISLFSDMVVYSSYAMQIVMSFMMLIMIFIILPRASVSATRINEVLSTVPNINDGTITEYKNGNGEIEFKNVNFKYPDADEYILEDINFKVNAGETVAFIGSTGSGKSTLINLVPRFYDVSSGEILIDGINIKEYTQKALHNKIGYVPQKAVMFSGTVSSNIDFGDSGNNKISKEDIKSAVKTAQGQDFVEKMENSYDADISQGGTNISGGQKQRLAIARAIARNPEIFIFDDSFSALDYKTDKILRKELKERTSNATSLIVAQRISTIKDADKIIVLDEGKMVGMGTHKQLLQDCSVYKEIALSQLSKEELGI